MAVYRSDQAQVTFGPEAGHGGYTEAATTATAATSGDAGAGALDAATHSDTTGFGAGSRQIIVDGVSGSPTTEFQAGDYIQIGNNTGTTETEIRRCEFVSQDDPASAHCTINLDSPLGFFHADNEVVTIVTAVTETNEDKFITWIPGVYETVDVPDPEMAIEGRYLLGTNQKRNWFVAYKGQQTFSGSISSFILLNGWPLRYSIGKVNSIPVGGHTTRTDLNAANTCKKGDYWISVDETTNLAPGSVITIDYNASPSATTDSEIRRVLSRSGTSGAGLVRLNYPLHFDHTPASSGDTQIGTISGATYYQHNLYETVDLDTMSWQVHMRDSAETATKDFDRRYFGGHVGSTTISAEEGGLLTAGWDSVTFQDMVHNQEFSSAYGSGTTELPGYTYMQSIASDNVGVPLSAGTYSSAISDLSAGGFPSTDPYYFSQGLLQMFGVGFGRVRSFSLSINNGEEPKYYIGGQGKGTLRHRGPTEIREAQREYSMSASIALPDSVIGDKTSASTARRLFTELLLEGDYGTTTSNMTGLAIVLTFTRATNDTITVTIPGSSGGSAAGSPAAGGGKQGAFIRSAPHTLSGDNPFQTDIDVLFRNMDIVIKDSEPYYP